MVLAGLGLYLLRAVLLWIVVPLAIVTWLLLLPIQIFVTRPIMGLPRWIRWADGALIAVLVNLLFRWEFGAVPWPGQSGFEPSEGGAIWRDFA